MGWGPRGNIHHHAFRRRNPGGPGQRVQPRPGDEPDDVASPRVGPGPGKPYFAGYSPGITGESLTMDVAEMNLLSGLQDKRSLMERVEQQNATGVNRIAAINGTTPATSPVPFEAGRGALVNRSPVTNNHYHTYPAAGPTVIEPPAQPKEPNPWPWIFATVLVASLVLGGLLYWLSTRTPATVPNTGQYGLGLDDLKVY